MGYGDPETPQEELRMILEVCEHLTSQVISLSNCIALTTNTEDA